VLDEPEYFIERELLRHAGNKPDIAKNPKQLANPQNFI
jgi:hypothetical protein